MKKIFFGFIRASVVIMILLLVAISLIAVVSVVGAFAGVLMGVIFVLAIPVLLYNLVVKSKKV